MKAFLLLLAAMQLPSSESQSIGPCPLTLTTEFLGMLPEAVACTRDVTRLFMNPPSVVPLTTSEVNDTLNTICTPDCGQALANYVGFDDCGSTEFSTEILISCLPTGDLNGTRCRFAFPQHVEGAVFDALSACANFDPSDPTCDPACADALMGLNNSIGCCYRSLYTNPRFIEFLIDNQAFTRTRADYITTVSNPSVWSACNVPQPAECTGDPFPGESTLQVGTCTGNEIDEFVENNVSPTCRNGYQVAFGTPNATKDQREEAFNAICTQDCAGTVMEYERENCESVFESFLGVDLCHQSTGNLGSRCAVIIGPQLPNETFFGAIGSNCLGYDPEVGTCPPGCQAALMEVETQMGCCYQSFFNNTQFLHYTLLDRQLTFDQRTFFELLGRDGVWNACDVPLVSVCTGEPLGQSGAVTFVPSVTIVFLVALLVFLF